MSLSAHLCIFARGQGFEPRLTGPEPAVLPLDDPRKRILLGFYLGKQKTTDK